MKQHLAAIRTLFDWLVMGSALTRNPAGSVRGPKFVVKRGRTPSLRADQARQLLDSIDTSTVIGLRDRAIIAMMLYGFARVGPVVGMKVEGCYPDGLGWWFRFRLTTARRSRCVVFGWASAYRSVTILPDTELR